MKEDIQDCAGKMELVLNSIAGFGRNTKIFECRICGTKIAEYGFPWVYHHDPEHPKNKAEYFQLTCLPGDGDGFFVLLEFNYILRKQFWRGDHCWSLFWSPIFIADNVENILNGEEIVFGNLAGSSRGSESIKLKPLSDNKTIKVELLAYDATYNDLSRRELLDSLEIGIDEAVFQLARCFFRYLEYISDHEKAKDSIFGYLNHPIIRDERVKKVLIERNCFFNFDLNPSDTSIQRALCSLIQKMKSIKVQEENFNNHNFLIWTFFNPGEKRLLSVLLPVLAELYNYADDNSALMAVLTGKIEIETNEERVGKMVTARLS